MSKNENCAEVLCSIMKENPRQVTTFIEYGALQALFDTFVATEDIVLGGPCCRWTSPRSWPVRSAAALRS